MKEGGRTKSLIMQLNIIPVDVVDRQD